MRGFVTDLNDRERRHFAKVFASLTDTAAELARSLREEDDDALLVGYFAWSLASAEATKLGEVITDALRRGKIDVPDDPRGAEGRS